LAWHPRDVATLADILERQADARRDAERKAAKRRR